ncbi:hypothetical protein GBAR_LOCUS18407, partial [Geodia barretti]
QVTFLLFCSLHSNPSLSVSVFTSHTGTPRQSKLTYILKQSLGGNARTTIICTVSR